MSGANPTPASSESFRSNSTGSTSKTKGILSLVFGIISIVLSPFFPIVWILVGIAAVVLGIMSRRSEPAAGKLGLAGIITGSIGIVLCIASMVIGAIILAELTQQAALPLV